MEITQDRFLLLGQLAALHKCLKETRLSSRTTADFLDPRAFETEAYLARQINRLLEAGADRIFVDGDDTRPALAVPVA